MDLTEISRNRVKIDLEVAQCRIVDLSVLIGKASAELQTLRAELREMQAAVAPDAQRSAVAGELASFSTDGVSSFPRQAVPSPAQMSGALTADSVLQWLVKLTKPHGKAKVMRWHVDHICGAAAPRTKGGFAQSVSKSQFAMLSITGWAVPTPGGQAFSTVKLLIDGPGGQVTREVNTYVREDVGMHVGDITLSSSGFRFDIPMSNLADGSQVISLVGCDRAGNLTQARIGRIDLI